jgi:hypothetical protein
LRDFVIPNNTAAGRAFYVVDVVLSGSQWLRTYSQFAGISMPPPVDVVGPAPVPTEKIELAAQGPSIMVFTNGTDSDDSVLHEYGHVVAKTVGIYADASGEHFITDALATTYSDTSRGIGVAWNEGFADFFAKAAEQAEHVAPGGYVINAGTSNQYSLAADGPPAVGEDNQVSVARILWHFYLIPSGPDRSFQLVRALGQSPPTMNLSTAVQRIMETESATPAPETLPGGDAPPAGADNERRATEVFGPVLAEQAVAPKFTSPASGTSINAAKQGTEFRWVSGQPAQSTVDRLDRFVFQLWQDDYTRMLGSEVIERGWTQTSAHLFVCPHTTEGEDNVYTFCGYVGGLLDSIGNRNAAASFHAVLLGSNIAASSGAQPAEPFPYISAPLTFTVTPQGFHCRHAGQCRGQSPGG